MDAEKEISEEAVNAAWAQFQRMPSSNPSDYAHAVVHAVMPLVRTAQADAFEAAWWSSGEGFNGEFPDEGVPWESSAGREAYTRWVEQNSEGNET